MNLYQTQGLFIPTQLLNPGQSTAVSCNRNPPRSWVRDSVVPDVTLQACQGIYIQADIHKFLHIKSGMVVSAASRFLHCFRLESQHYNKRRLVVLVSSATHLMRSCTHFLFVSLLEVFITKCFFIA